MAKTPRTLKPVTRRMFSTAAVIAAATIFGLTYRIASFLRSLCNPELWVASQLRKHAEAMAWTPGLVLDYVRAARRHQSAATRYCYLDGAHRNAYRGIKERREFIARIRARAAAASTANAAKAGAAAVRGVAKSAAARNAPEEN